MANAATIRLVEDGAGIYRLEGEGLFDVAAFDLTIDYDAAGLTISSVTQGEMLQGGLFVTNLNQPGKIRIGVVLTQPVSGTGTLAYLTGTVLTGVPDISALHSILSSANGASIPVQNILLPPPISYEESQPETLPPADNGVSAGSSGHTFRTTSGLEPATQSNLSKQMVGSFPNGGISSSAGNGLPAMDMTGEYGTGKEKYLVSVLERFNRFEGERTLVDLMPLFDRENRVVQQLPQVVLSDGKTEVIVALFGWQGDESNIALRNARLLGIEVVSQAEWRIRLLPVENVVSADLFLLGIGEMVEIPLTVAPPVSLKATGVPIDVILPQVDLDGDGEWTPTDDYILVANQLVLDLIN